MKVTIQKGEDRKKKNKYPYYGESTQGRIVLFTSCQEGVCIYDPNGTNEIGHISQYWTESKFTPITDLILIEP